MSEIPIEKDFEVDETDTPTVYKPNFDISGTTTSEKEIAAGIQLLDLNTNPPEKLFEIFYEKLKNWK